MNDSTENNKTGFIGNLFRSCPSCGELIRMGENQCRFCGASTDSSDNEIEITLHPRKSPEQNARVEIMPNVRESGQPGVATAKVPLEYLPGFNPSSFSFAAFFFADLWHAEKGLIQVAISHFLLRLIVTLTGVGIIVVSASMIDSSGSVQDAPGNVAAWIGFMIIVWLIAFGFDAVRSFKNAALAHKRLHDLKNSLTQEQYLKLRKEGAVLYWSMLYIPFIIFLLIFIFILP